MDSRALWKFAANKLVRDQTVERLRKRGVTCRTRILNDAEYAVELRKKLVEEAQEVAEVSSSQELMTELADVLEVVHAMCDAHQISFEEVERVRHMARADRGGFGERLYVAYVKLVTDNPYVEYYRSKPHKYPEILE